MCGARARGPCAGPRRTHTRCNVRLAQGMRGSLWERVGGSSSRTLAASFALLAIAAAPAGASFNVGAASTDVTPPPYTTASDAAFVPACGATPAQVAELWPGPRKFA